MESLGLAQNVLRQQILGMQRLNGFGGPTGSLRSIAPFRFEQTAALIVAKTHASQLSNGFPHDNRSFPEPAEPRFCEVACLDVRARPVPEPDQPLVFEIVMAYSLFAFLVSFFREIVKDMEDIRGDAAGGCRTLPIVAGVKASRWTVTALVVLGAELDDGATEQVELNCNQKVDVELEL